MDERRENQYDRAVPDTILRPLVEKYFSYGFGDKKILRSITKEIDLESNRWTLSTKTIQRRRKDWGLLSVKQQHHTIATIAPFVEKFRIHSANRLGVKSLRDHLREEKILVSRGILQQYQSLADPIGCRQRRAGQLTRAIYWSAGLHESWSFDQHNKWRRIGLWLHCGLEGFSNFVLWLKIWWTNSNPRLIASFYFEAATRLGGIPMLTRSDPGTENHGIANAQTTLRRQLDPSLQGTLQHKWMRGHSNIKPEIFWSKLRKQWSPGWEILFDKGLEQGWYDPKVAVELLLFRWLAIPMLQEDLNRFARIHNHSKPRRDNKKSMPAEIPNVLMEQPDEYGPFCDYKITVPAEMINQVATLFAPPEHEVFQLVPERFEKQAKTLFDELGHPAVDRESFWAIYLMMLEGFMSLPEAEAVALWEDVHSNEAREETIQCEFMDVLPGLAVRGGPAMVGHAGKNYSSFPTARGAGEDPSRAGSNDESLSEPGDEDDVPTVDMTPHV
ncbi:hypothetical protein CALVIDRAFT_569823 [Calocera viscosa TUFC12733]|uniref:Integrase core domain-containing protein n=1 Tax=Calocera viscosa (strain TUFC12733) TaxID=1330018 RepID=A0A167FJB8_CALVF|nr:hypothetical protein CALVIDRAFT_569823 [Calocera viscosa TUFC12733]